MGTALDEKSRVVTRFREKPDADSAAGYLAEGPEHYLWNSGMFVWRAETFLHCVAGYEPRAAAGVRRIAKAWDSAARNRILEEVYPTLEKTSMDYAVMERACPDPSITVAAIPMVLRWKDIGAWSAVATLGTRDERGNTLKEHSALLLDTRDTLVCPMNRAQDVKNLYAQAVEKFGREYV